jgi:hypothetical protein
MRRWILMKADQLRRVEDQRNDFFPHEKTATRGRALVKRSSNRSMVRRRPCDAGRAAANRCLQRLRPPRATS